MPHSISHEVLWECDASSHRFLSRAWFDPKRHGVVSHSESFAKPSRNPCLLFACIACFAGSTLVAPENAGVRRGERPTISVLSVVEITGVRRGERLYKCGSGLSAAIVGTQRSLPHSTQKEKRREDLPSRRCFLYASNCLRRYFTATVNWMLPYLRVIWNV